MDFLAPVPNPQPEPEPRIPLDIQLAIVDMCPDVRTRLRLVSTHKAVRYRGARLALQLSSARVQLRSQSSARSFFAFCAAQGLPREPSSPIALLHTLDIDVATVNPADTGNMVTLLANVPRLTSLTLRHPEAALWSVSSLYPTLQRLRTLKTFHVHEAGPMAVKLVSEIASALEDITIDPHHDPSTDEDGVRIHGLNTHLARHKDTLRRIFVRGVNILEDEYDIVGDLVIFEKVRELVIPDCVIRDALYCMKAFPNAVSLDVGTTLTTRAKRLTRKMIEWRAKNRAILLDDDAIRAGQLSWPVSLEHVRGGLLDLYVFGNAYWIEFLEIDGLIKDDSACVLPMVQSHCPEILRLSVSSSLRVDVWEKYRGTLDSVTCLVLQLVVEDLVDLKQLTSTAIRAVGSFKNCEVVFLDFAARDDGAYSRLQGLDHRSLRRIIKPWESGPSDIIIRSPVETTYWCRNPLSVRTWVVQRMSAKTNFQTVDCFPKDYVTDDWL
ncbi:hypothetical protein V8D89_004543 [Ganoderma adspersum]